MFSRKYASTHPSDRCSDAGYSTGTQPGSPNERRVPYIPNGPQLPHGARFSFRPNSRSLSGPGRYQGIGSEGNPQSMLAFAAIRVSGRITSRHIHRCSQSSHGSPYITVLARPNSFPYLKHINLAGTYLEDQDIRWISVLSSLRTLSLARCKIRDEAYGLICHASDTLLPVHI